MLIFSSRNNSARELSAFAESAMAVNRVVLQHFSMNLELGCTETPSLFEPSAVLDPGLNNRATEGTALFGLSPPSESRLIQRRKAQSLTKKCNSDELLNMEDNNILGNHITANSTNKIDSTSVTTTLEGKKLGNLLVVASSPTSTPAPVVVVASPSGWNQKWICASVRTWFINYNFFTIISCFFIAKTIK